MDPRTPVNIDLLKGFSDADLLREVARRNSVPNGDRMTPLCMATRDQIIEEFFGRNHATVVFWDGLVEVQPGKYEHQTRRRAHGLYTHIYGLVRIHGDALLESLENAITREG